MLFNSIGCAETFPLRMASSSRKQRMLVSGWARSWATEWTRARSGACGAVTVAESLYVAAVYFWAAAEGEVSWWPGAEGPEPWVGAGLPSRYPAPRTVWISFAGLNESIFLRR